MGRGKSRRKHKQKLKREIKIKLGKFVPFSLANSSKKYTGFSNKYCYKTNIHNLIYKDGHFENVKFQASNITSCNFKNASLKGVDFFNSNLKGTSFRDGQLEDVVFFNCNLKGTDFEDVIFKNVVFIATNTDVAKNLTLNDECRLLKQYPRLKLSDSMQIILEDLSTCGKIYNYHVLHVSKEKPNMWVLSLLFQRYGEDLERALRALINRRNQWGFFTVSAFKNFIDRYLKR